MDPHLQQLILLLLQPAAAATVAGRVSAWPEGTPIEGVAVHVTDLTGRSWPVDSASDGSWSAQVPAGRYRVKALPDEGANRIPAWWGDRPFFCGSPMLTLGPDRSVTGIDHELPEGGEVAGTVSGAGPNAWVWADGTGAFGQVVRHGAPVEADGSYRIGGLDAPVQDGVPQTAPYRLEVRAPGRPSWGPGGWNLSDGPSVPVRRREATVLDLVAPATREVQGTVLLDGVPVGEATVELQMGFWRRQIPVDALGVWQGDEVPTLALSVRVRTPSRPWSEASEIPAGPSHSGLALSPGPVGGWLQVIPPSDGAWAGAVLSAGTELRSLADEPVELGPFPPGPVPVRLLRGSREDLVAVGPDSTVDVVAGVTVDAAPEAVPGRVLMVDVTGRGWGALPSARVEVDGGLLSGSTGEDGSARIAGLPLGAIRVAVSWPTFCDGDPGWVPLFSGGGAEPSLAAPTDAAQLSFVLPPDADADGMDDDWELLHGLDPSRDDGGLDPDGDGLTNLTAYRMGLLPTEPSRACERTDSQALALVFGAVFASIRRPRRGEDSLDAAEPRPHPPAAER